MSYIIAGLGNPGHEYEMTRHNTGRIVLDYLVKENGGGEYELDKKAQCLVSSVKIGKSKVLLLAPETFMNNSGRAIAKFVKSKKLAEELVVIYDDFNLPLGRMKLSFNRSSGGHNGVQSVISHLKTEGFWRLRIGTAPANSKGEAKVPHGEEKIEKFILGKFKDDELKALKKISKSANDAVALIISEGPEKAMNVVNSSK